MSQSTTSLSFNCPKCGAENSITTDIGVGNSPINCSRCTAELGNFHDIQALTARPALRPATASAQPALNAG